MIQYNQVFSISSILYHIRRVTLITQIQNRFSIFTTGSSY